MVDDVTIAVAAAVAGKLAETVTQTTKDGAKALLRVLRERFGNRPEAQETLTRARDEDGEDAELVRKLATHIDELRETDPEVRRLVEELGPKVTRQGDVHNTIVGDVSGTAIQARDVEGGLTIRHRS